MAMDSLEGTLAAVDVCPLEVVKLFGIHIHPLDEILYVDVSEG